MSLDAPDSFPVTQRNRLKRRHDRGHYDRAAIYPVLDAGMLAHVAYVIDGQPFCTPTIHWRTGDVLYWHGSAASRMLRHLRAGTPACVTVSHLDALVLARTGFNHSLDYRSAMCFGTARLVEDPVEKTAALEALVDRFYPGRHATLRETSTQEAKATTVVAMPIDEASAKIRAKGLADDAEDMAHPVWAGVIPVRTVIGEDRVCESLLPGIARPEGLGAYRTGRRLDEALREAQAAWEGLVPAETGGPART